MAENKTKPTSESVTAFLNKIENSQLKDDCFAIVKMMQTISKTKPVMWGSSIIGFGTFHYVYESGREGDTVVIGFSPRKQNITFYIMHGMEKVKDDLPKLGKYKTGGGCLYIKSLSDVNLTVLKKILTKAYKNVKGQKSVTSNA
jgi:hypothetical protein